MSEIPRRKSRLKQKIKVVTPTLNKRFSSLNKQAGVCPFLDRKGLI